MTIRVITADDHDAVIAGVTGLLEGEADVEIVGAAGDAGQLLELLRTVKCDVLVTDFSMPQGDSPDGIQMLDKLHRQYPGMAIVLLTMMSNAVALKSAIKHGVIGLCDKAAAADDIVAAVRSAVRGERFLSASFQGLLEGDDESNNERLSPHEVEVVRLFGEGYSIVEISVQLNRSKQTISRQKRDAMVKLGLESDDQLLSYARSAGLAP